MFDWTTIFLFTYKAQAIVNALQKAVRSDVIAIVICVLYLIYVAIAKITKRTYFDRKLLPVAFFVLVIGFSHLQDTYRQLQYFQNEYAKLVTIYEKKTYKIAEGTVHVQHMESAEGHTAGDIIWVDGVEIEFRCANLTPAYNEIIAFGGVLTEGTMARIYYYQSGTEFLDQNLILRIDLPNNKSSTNENSTILHCTR